jgi:hypothetical protein
MTTGNEAETRTCRSPNLARQTDLLEELCEIAGFQKTSETSRTETSKSTAKQLQSMREAEESPAWVDWPRLHMHVLNVTTCLGVTEKNCIGLARKILGVERCMEEQMNE